MRITHVEFLNHVKRARVACPVAPFWGKRRDRITFVRVYKAEIETEPQPNLATATDTIHTLSDVLASMYQRHSYSSED